MSTTGSPRVEGSIPFIGNFLVEFILLCYNSGRSDRIIYLKKTSSVCGLPIVLVDFGRYQTHKKISADTETWI